MKKCKWDTGRLLGRLQTAKTRKIVLSGGKAVSLRKERACRFYSFRPSRRRDTLARREVTEEHRDAETRTAALAQFYEINLRGRKIRQTLRVECGSYSKRLIGRLFLAGNSVCTACFSPFTLMTYGI